MSDRLGEFQGPTCPFCGKPRSEPGRCVWSGVFSDVGPVHQLFHPIVVAQDADPVSHPKHYNVGKFEVIDVIEDWKLDFHLGNAVKYIAGAGHKDPSKLKEDLEKAAWYLDRKIKSLKPTYTIPPPEACDPQLGGPCHVFHRGTKHAKACGRDRVGGVEVAAHCRCRCHGGSTE